MEFTSEQKSAIYSRDKNILVSAGAGSGKTAVLVERILSLITDEENPCDLTELAVVTFTNAAAAEMRGRLARRLSDALSADPGNPRLRRQLSLVNFARISTVHTLCLRLIKENFTLAGVDPSFRMLDEDESAILKKQALDDLLEEKYAAGQADFIALADRVCGAKNDRALADIILDVYEQLASFADPDGYISRALSLSGETAAETYLQSEVGPGAAAFLSLYAQAISELKSDGDPAAGRVLPIYQKEYHSLKALSEGNDFEGAAATMSNLLDFDRLPSSGKSPAAKRAKAVRDLLKKWARGFEKGVLFQPKDERALDEAVLAADSAGIYALARAFEEKYSELKKEQGVLDFADLEHIALKLLCEGFDGEGSPIPSEVAQTVGNGLRELLVDEYQDTNDIQEAIFRCLTCLEKTSFFAVGDVKQSVYRFRQADPGIFIARAQRYERNPKEGRLIRLTQNFRSCPQVLDSVNFVFSALMRKELGEMDYTESEMLRPGSEGQGKCGGQTELVYIDAESADEEGESLSAVEAEARAVAAEIERILSKGTSVTGEDGIPRPARPSDIAVIMRSAVNRAPVFESVIREKNIPASSDVGMGFFESAEVTALISLLSVVDNPRQDVPLAGLLRSPLVGFSASELAQIRLADCEGDFYSALRAKAGEPDALGARCRGFVDWLERLRADAADLGVSRLLSYLIDETGAFGVYHALEGGAARRENLLTLSRMALEYEKRNGKWAGGFLRYLSELAARENPPGRGAGREGEGVRIMTVHKSKGLEFPIVILACLSDRVSSRWKSGAVLIHKTRGLGLYRYDAQNGVKRTTLRRELVKAALYDEQLAEELRILYVAMTRAKDKLIMCLRRKNSDDENEIILSPSAFACKSNPCLGGWVEMVCKTSPGPIKLRFAGENGKKTPDLLPENPHFSPDLTEKISESLGFSYKFLSLSAVPAGITATGYLSAENPETLDISTVSDDSEPMPKPKFISGYDRPTAAERGTATHLFLSLYAPEKALFPAISRDFATNSAKTDFEKQIPAFSETFLAENMANFIESLVNKNILDKTLARSINIKKLASLFSGPIGKLIFSAKNPRREFKFRVFRDVSELFPAPELFPPPKPFPPLKPFPPPKPFPENEIKPDAEKVLVQGVIDLWFEEPDNTVSLLDFKTDRVSPKEARARAAKYLSQITIYADALREITGKRVKHAYLCFTEAECLVDMLNYSP